MTRRQWFILFLMGVIGLIILATVAGLLFAYGEASGSNPSDLLAGFSAKEATSGQNSNEGAKPEATADPNNTPPPGDGFFLWTGIAWRPMLGLHNDANLDLEILPASDDSSPIFAVQGEGYQVGAVRLSPYYAGIGVDLEWTLNGVIVKIVYDWTPAAAAGIRPGDVLFSVDGKEIKPDLVRASLPNQADLFGIMKNPILVEMMTGTTKRTIEISRTYTGSVEDFVITTYEMFHRPNTKFTIVSKGVYVLLLVDDKLEKGSYRWELPGRLPTQGPTPGIRIGGFSTSGTLPPPTAVPTWTPAPTAVIAPIYPFTVE